MRAALVVSTAGRRIEENLRRMVEAVGHAARAGAQLAVFPEAAPTGLANNDDPAHDLRLGQTVPGPAIDLLAQAAQRHRIHVATGILERDANRLYDSAVLMGPGGDIPLHYRRIQPQWHGRDADPCVYRQGAEVGIADTALGRIGVLLCGDLFDDGIVERLRSAAPQIVLVPFARNFGDGTADQARWDREEEPHYVERASRLACPVLMVNLIEDAALTRWPAFGGALAVDGRGEIIARHALGAPGTLHVEVDAGA